METSLDTGAGAAAVPQPSAPPAPGTVYSVLGAISFSHMLNDMIQSLILAIYPMLKSQFALSFAQIGLITLTYQITASLLQRSSASTPTNGRNRIRCRWGWASRWPGCC